MAAPSLFPTHTHYHHMLEQAQQYLARALPWPQDGEPPAFVNVHWTFVPDDLKPGQKLPWTGRACRSLAEAVDAVGWALNNETTRDIYACLSTQRAAKEKVGKRGYKYYQPIRAQQNAVAIKALFLDIDFKGGDHGYDTQEEAVRELARFLKETNLPKPSMLVLSGGGVHVYWTLSRPLPLAEWQPLAYALAEATKRHGLKCDSQCTVDGARVLRIPNTFNRKTADPRPVSFAGRGTDFDYTVERLDQALSPYKTVVPKAPVGVAALYPNIFPTRPPLQENPFGACGGPSFTPFKLDEVAQECSFVGRALSSGGLAYSQAEWNLTSLIATFCEDGRTQAHRMGDKHPGYTRESTDEMYDRKVREKETKGLGWPSCASIRAAGSKACAACKHFAVGKTPLHAALRAIQPGSGPAAPALPASLGTPGAPITSQVTDLPDGYQRDPDGRVMRVTSNEDGSANMEMICEYSMEDPWLQRDPAILHFTAKVERGRTRLVNIPLEMVGTMEMRKHFQSQEFMLPVGAKATENVSRFLMSWIKKLHDTRDSVRSSPFGWHHVGANLEGFVFGGQLWTPSGSKPSANGDQEIARQYAPSGTRGPWVAAAKMVTDQKRPALEAILASSFGAPLIAFTGEPGVLMSAYSKQSGIGKSTVLKIAQAVWGDPITSVQSLDDTQNSVMHKLGQLRSLPLYWDELKTEDHTRKFVSITFQTTQGKEKARLGRTIQQREPGRWQTLLVSASNDSLLDYVARYTSTTTAGLYRVFEFTVPPPDSGAPGQLVPSDAALLVAKLQNHHGVIGLEYAQYLGMYHAQIAADMKAMLDQLHTETSSRADERFWLALTAGVLLGARYANHLGFTAFDEVALKAFMLDELAKQREHVKSQPVDMAQEMNVSNLLSQFLAAMRGRHALYTNNIHVARGKPVAGSIMIEGSFCDPTRIEGVFVHIGVNNKLMRISHYRLCEWLREKGVSPVVFVSSLVDEFKAKKTTAILGSGLPKFSTPPVYVIELDLAANPTIDFLS